MAIDRSQWDAQFGSGTRGPYDLTILMASFTTDARIQDGQQYVLLISGVDENDEPVEEMLSVGANWESFDGGVTITNPSKSATVNKSTNYGQWCQYAAAACEAAGAEWIFSANAHDARIWVGQKFHMEEKQTGEAFFNRKTNEQVAARFRLMPDTYLGVDGSATPPTPPPTAPAEPSPAPTPAPAPSEPAQPATAASPPVAAPPVATGTSQVIASQLAQTSPDYQTFINAALAVDTIATDDVLVPQLLDTSDTGFYATHHTV